MKVRKRDVVFRYLKLQKLFGQWRGKIQRKIQKEAVRVPENIDTIREGELCKNCGTQLEGPYCHNCGQYHSISSMTMWGLVKVYLSQSFGLDRALLYTLRTILLYPGVATLRFMNGRIASHTHPLAINIILMAVFIPLFALNVDRILKTEDNPVGKMVAGIIELSQSDNDGLHFSLNGRAVAGKEGEAVVDRFEYLFAQSFPGVLILSIPILSMGFYLKYRKRGFRFRDTTIMVSHYMSYLLMWLILAMMLAWMNILFSWMQQVIFVFSGVYIVIASLVVFGGSWWRNILFTVFNMAINYLIIFVIWVVFLLLILLASFLHVVDVTGLENFME